MVKTIKNHQITMTKWQLLLQQFNNETNWQFSAPDKPMTNEHLSPHLLIKPLDFFSILFKGFDIIFYFLFR